MRNIALAVVFCLSLLVPRATVSAAEIVTIGTGPMGGAYYPVGVGFAELVGRHVPNVAPRVEVTAGALQNPSLVAQEEAEIAITNADTAFFAINGMPPFTEKLTNVRALFSGLAPGAFQYVVMDGSGINSVQDLVGKRVAVGPPGNSAGLNLKELMEFYGKKYTDIKPNYLPISDGVEQLLDGHVDMAIVQSGVPAPAIQEAYASGKKVRILSFPDEDRNRIVQKFPYFKVFNIDRKVYPGLGDEVVTTFATNNLLVVREDLSEELVYNITKAIFDHLDDFHKVHPAARWVVPETAVETPIPLHPGSEKYFREKGYLQ